MSIISLSVTCKERMETVQSEQWDWSMGPLTLKEQWKCVLTAVVTGAVFVMMAGMTVMPVWCAHSSGSPAQVIWLYHFFPIRVFEGGRWDVIFKICSNTPAPFYLLKKTLVHRNIPLIPYILRADYTMYTNGDAKSMMLSHGRRISWSHTLYKVDHILSHSSQNWC